MKELFVSKKDFEEFLNFCCRDATILGPRRDEQGVIRFCPASSVSELVLEDAARSNMSAKQAVLAQTEVLFFFENGDDGPSLSDVVEKDRIVVVGLRPCDARGIWELDRVFSENIDEGLYAKRRKNVALIGLSCIKPDVTCFCSSVGGSPGGQQGLDLLLSKVDDGFVVSICSDVGEKLVSDASMLSEAPKEALEKRDETLKNAEESMKKSVKTQGVEKHLESVFNSSYWEQISESCIGCGVCTFVCPTCYCFDMQDESDRRGGVRLRIWDSCMYPEYTAHASGYNPRPDRLHRLRNRVFHKFVWMKKEYDFFGCTGCGRCVRLCPVNIDIVELVNGCWEAKK